MYMEITVTVEKGVMLQILEGMEEGVLEQEVVG
jgi:hypothetical protein